MKNLLRELWRDYRARKAADMRRRVKLAFFWEDVALWKAGKVTSEQSLQRRLEFYDKVDTMSDEEILA